VRIERGKKDRPPRYTHRIAILVPHLQSFTSQLPRHSLAAVFVIGIPDDLLTTPSDVVLPYSAENILAKTYK
jgi:hypothetical protein